MAPKPPPTALKRSATGNHWLGRTFSGRWVDMEDEEYEELQKGVSALIAMTPDEDDFFQTIDSCISDNKFPMAVAMKKARAGDKMLAAISLQSLEKKKSSRASWVQWCVRGSQDLLLML
jgi:hypothetical protein